MIIALVSQKGGAGKTTLSVNIAALAATNGIDVALVDLDPQASASAWCAARGADDIRLEACHPPMLTKTISRLRMGGAGLVIIDTPPHSSTAAANAVRAADFVVVPVRPASFDLAAVADTAELVRHVSGRAGAVLNAVPPSTNVAEPAAALLAEQGLPVLARIGQRMAVQHAATAGRGVVETEPRSQAASEIVDLWNAITERVP
jgi:chromosome partitioning protein